MSTDILALLARATLALSAALILILALRHPLRAAFGAQIAYAFWLIAPIATLAAFLPARTIWLAPPQTIADAALAGSAQAPALAQPAEAIAASGAMLDWLTPALLLVWLAGAAFALAAMLHGQRRFLANAAEAGPAVVGVLRPRIVLPADFEARYTPDERALVVAHERAHLKAGDAQINALAAFIQCLMWFNPLVHVARAALRVDQELACDARVMAARTHEKRAYAEAMLKTQLAARAVPLGCQWPPIGAKPLKQRIAMLARPAPNTAQRAMGAAFCALTIVAAAALAWAAQPARVAYAQTEAAGDRALGRALVEALNDGDMAQARHLIERGADVNTMVAGDGTPLVIAARYGDTAFAQYLIERGANVNQPAPGDGNPLIMAAMHGHLEMAQLLVRNGADVNGIVRGDETPLINAARSNRLDIASFLIAQGADVNLSVIAPVIDGSQRRSPLSEARRRSHTAMIALLRQHGATS